MSLMKLRRNRKGFTLIEMMIVIAVIAILAAVIIPKSGLVQNTAKESGVEANARVVQGIIENMKPRYGMTNLLTKAATKINDADIVNPITHGSSVDLDSATANSTAVVYSANAPAPTETNLEGVVWVEIPTAGNKVMIHPFDKNGKLIPETAIIVE
jgi:prepilin-type N-terminal cleavage/methylation domain-containing protein